MDQSNYKVVSWTWACVCGHLHRTILIGDAGSHEDDALAFLRFGSEAGIIHSEPCIRSIDIEEFDSLLGPELCGQ